MDEAALVIATRRVPREKKARKVSGRPSEG
jgi:hypothetical protein